MMSWDPRKLLGSKSVTGVVTETATTDDLFFDEEEIDEHIASLSSESAAAAAGVAFSDTDEDEAMSPAIPPPSAPARATPKKPRAKSGATPKSKALSSKRAAAAAAAGDAADPPRPPPKKRAKAKATTEAGVASAAVGKKKAAAAAKPKPKAKASAKGKAKASGGANKGHSAKNEAGDYVVPLAFLTKVCHRAGSHRNSPEVLHLLRDQYIENIDDWCRVCYAICKSMGHSTVDTRVLETATKVMALRKQRMLLGDINAAYTPLYNPPKRNFAPPPAQEPAQELVETEV